MDWKKKIGSRKFWACITAVIISMVAFTSATPETTERIVALISAIGGLSIYMLSEGLADSKPVDITVDTKEVEDNE
ncbi:MAG: hypothetical protein KHZ78_07850 [Peptoniphilus sp. oral taxon 375]|nr:hypothetical protein [Peptoniphilus sp. oral taxon 375]